MNEEEFDQDVYERIGIGYEMSWRLEDFDKRWTKEYKAFVENDFNGILDEKAAIECYRRYSGRHPSNVTEWPEISEISKERAFRKSELGLTDKEAEDYFSKFLPYEPILKYAY